MQLLPELLAGIPLVNTVPGPKPRARSFLSRPGHQRCLYYEVGTGTGEYAVARRPDLGATAAGIASTDRWQYVARYYRGQTA